MTTLTPFSGLTLNILYFVKNNIYIYVFIKIPLKQGIMEIDYSCQTKTLNKLK